MTLMNEETARRLERAANYWAWSGRSRTPPPAAAGTVEVEQEVIEPVDTVEVERKDLDTVLRFLALAQVGSRSGSIWKMRAQATQEAAHRLAVHLEPVL